MEIKKQTITPKQAAEWLACNTKNRGLAPRRVQAIARDIEAGRWNVNESLTAPIIIGADGVLANGQHRLNAIVKAGKPVTAFVVHGMEPNTRMDNVRARSMGDNLRMAGVKNYNHVAAVARICVIYGASQANTVPTQEEMQMAIDGLGITDIAPYVAAMMPPYRLSAVYAVWILARVSHPDAANDFMDQYKSGVGLSENSPILTLRNRFARDPSSRINGSVPFNLVAAAWNAFQEHRSLNKIVMQLGGFADVNGAPRDLILGKILGV